MTLPAHIQVNAVLPGGVIVTQVNADDTFMVDVPCPGGFTLPRKYDIADLHEEDADALQATIRGLKRENRMLRGMVDALLVIVAALKGWRR